MNGLGTVWANAAKLAKNYVKSKIRQRLQDQYVQHYGEYITNNKVSGQTAVLDICGVGGFNYGMCSYMTEITDPQIRSFVTKLRIDNNNLADCKYRSFRFKDQPNDMCSFCGVRETVQHRILSCKQDNIKSDREKFIESMSYVVPDFKAKNEHYLLQFILNVNVVEHNDKQSTGIICNYIKMVYQRVTWSDSGA